MTWVASDGWLVDEDRALRDWLLGMKVFDDRNQSREVGVWYSHPDVEVRDQRFPYLVITLVDIVEATDRVMSWYHIEPPSLDPSMLMDVYQSTYDDTYGLSPEIKYYAEEPPVPVYVDYQIKAYSRHPRHNRAILAQMLAQKTPYRWGMLPVKGQIHRRLTLLDVAHQEFVEQNKRTFATTFTVRVDGWMPTARVRAVFPAEVRTTVLNTVVSDPQTIRTTNSELHPSWDKE